MNTTCASGGEVDCVRVDGVSVFIQRSEEWDTGRYTCIAENEAGRAVYEVFVTVFPLEGMVQPTCREVYIVLA